LAIEIIEIAAIGFAGKWSAGVDFLANSGRGFPRISSHDSLLLGVMSGEV
jgi:hypothetical protein